MYVPIGYNRIVNKSLSRWLESWYTFRFRLLFSLGQKLKQIVFFFEQLLEFIRHRRLWASMQRPNVYGWRAWICSHADLMGSGCEYNFQFICDCNIFDSRLETLEASGMEFVLHQHLLSLSLVWVRNIFGRSFRWNFDQYFFMLKVDFTIYSRPSRKYRVQTRWNTTLLRANCRRKSCMHHSIHFDLLFFDSSQCLVCHLHLCVVPTNKRSR